jgi:DNA-binding CsgD family transcriptional regulator
LTHGRRESAAADLRRCGEVMTALRIVNPIVSGWRSSLALALPAGERAEAQRLAAEELELSERTRLPRSRGIAMRTMGLLDRGDAGISLLREAASVLDSAGAPLEVARTLVELGAALRRANQRAAAREPLRTGLDLADRCGAERLAARAEEELRATGGKPRRRAVSGLDALTPSELRVARHATAGIGNREIAQALFVTTKTVENQLSVVYQKLGIRGRAELVALMGAAASTG